MITVKDVCKLFKPEAKVALVWRCCQVPFDRDDLLSMEAYGNFVVDFIDSGAKNYYEVNLAACPVKKEN